jgi:iron complex outermembrane recepter protein
MSTAFYCLKCGQQNVFARTMYLACRIADAIPGIARLAAASLGKETNKRLRFEVRPAAAVLWSLSLVNMVSAQQAPTGENLEPPSASQGLAEIVVTAEKRESTVQKTPISMTAISGQDLQAQGALNLLNVIQEVPGVSVRSAGPGQTEYEIRGMSSSGGTSPTVGFYIDETPLTPPATAQNGKVAIDPDLYDLSRVEVLRGPQGTLYGSGSMGGTIKLVTAQPVLNEFDASAESIDSGTESGGFNYGGSGMINVPVIRDTVALRVVGTYKYTDGWIDRIVLNNFPLETDPSCKSAGFYGCTRGNVLTAPVAKDYSDVNSERLEGVRASATIQPIEGLTITPSALYQSITMGGPSDFDDPPGTLAHYQPFDVAEPFADTFRLYSIVIKYGRDDFNVTAATSWWSREQDQTQDESEILQSGFGFPQFDTTNGLGAGPSSITEIDRTRQLSQEVRIASNDQGPFRWLAGAFYQDFKTLTTSYSYVPGLITAYGGAFGTSDFISFNQPTYLKQTAAFGEGSYDITSKLKATIGLRWYTYTSNFVNSENGIVTGGLAYKVTSGSAADNGTNPKFNLSYNLNDDTLLYATAAKGFRPGAANTPVPITGADSCAPALAALDKTQAPTQYQPDTVWSYELGEKARLFDQRVTVNGAIYYENWSGVQQKIVLSCGFNFVDNAGSAVTYGGELEIQARLTPELTLSQNASYTHATITAAAPGTGLQKGDKLQNVPSWTGSTALTYSTPINSQMDVVGRVQNNYIGNMQDVSYVRNDIPSYDLVDLRLGLAGSNRKRSAYFFVTNLTNKQAHLSDTIEYSENLPSFERVATNQPRTFGVDLSYRY